MIVGEYGGGLGTECGAVSHEEGKGMNGCPEDLSDWWEPRGVVLIKVVAWLGSRGRVNEADKAKRLY